MLNTIFNLKAIQQDSFTAFSTSSEGIKVQISISSHMEEKIPIVMKGLYS